ncbi:MAG: hypothetical protein HQK77_10975 [Desulfobacterales bacterium]|nr:hypothetical protein [Desulfobacterales bacterium]
MAKKHKHKTDKHFFQKDLGYTELIIEGQKRIDSEKYREAIDLFKLAQKKQATEEIKLLLFKAYSMRSNQLRNKGLISEADVVANQIGSMGINIFNLTENELILYLSSCPDQKVVDLYVKAVSSKQHVSLIEKILANRLITNSCWHLLNPVNSSFPFKQESLILQNAVSLMNDAKWEDALEVLRPISSKSSFAPIRSFCRAMVLFYQHDDDKMEKALSMIPNDFPLSRSVQDLKALLTQKTSKHNLSIPNSPIACLWEDGIYLKKYMHDLVDSFKKRNFQEVERLIPVISKQIYPQMPTMATQYLLEQMAFLAIDCHIEPSQYYKLISKLVPKEMSELLIVKIFFLISHDDPLRTMLNYLEYLHVEFKDKNQYNLAYSLLLKHAVKKITSEDYHEIDTKLHKLLTDKLSISFNSYELLMIQLLTKSIDLDPLNRTAYELLVKLPRNEKKSKNAVEDYLMSMKDRFPDDPFPCLELSSIYYEKNAYRKAELILDEAVKRAPHDSRVIEKRAISLLISASKNLSQDRLHLFTQDIQKAMVVGSKKVKPIVIQKQILHDVIVNRQNIKDVLENYLKELSRIEQLRVLCFLYMEIQKHKSLFIQADIDYTKKYFISKTKELALISSKDLLELLTPLESDYIPLVPSIYVAPVFLEVNADLVWKGFEDKDVLMLYEIILTKDTIPSILADVKKRIKKKNNQFKYLFEFYQAVLTQLHSKSKNAKLFNQIMSKASDAQLNELESLSKRLSKHATGIFKEALEKFDFSILNISRSPFSLDVLFDMFKDFMDTQTPKQNKKKNQSFYEEFEEYDEFNEFNKIFGDDDDGYDDDGEDDDDDYNDKDDEYDYLDTLFDELEDLDYNPAIFYTIDKDAVIERLSKGIEFFIDFIGIRGLSTIEIKESKWKLIKELKGDYDLLKRVVTPERFPYLSREAQVFIFGKHHKHK